MTNQRSPQNDLRQFAENIIVTGGDDIAFVDEPIVVETNDDEPKDDKKPPEFIDNGEGKETETVDVTGLNNPPAEEQEVTNLSLLVSELITNGVIPEYDMTEFNTLPGEKQLEALVAISKENQQKTAEAMLEEWASNFHPNIKKVIENYKEGVSVDTILGMLDAKNTVGSIKAEDIDANEANAERIMSYIYSRKNMTPDEVEEQIAILKESGKIKEVAKGKIATVEQMIEADEQNAKAYAKQQEENRINSIKESNNKFRETIKATETILGRQLTDDDRKQIYEVGVPDRTGKSLVDKTYEKNPMAFQMKINDLVRMGYFEDNFDPMKLLKPLEKQIKEGTFSELKKNEAKNRLFSNTGTSQQTRSQKNSLSLLLEKHNNSDLRW